MPETDQTTPHLSSNNQSAPPRIYRLPQDVINRIAAGEVVVRPSAALKELLENCLDANATAITVTAREGGLKLLQVTDNGGGISQHDLPLLCERFATSKITVFEDLQQIATFGFRGEALASISHVARLSVLTKTDESSVAFSASYLDGALRATPSPCAAKGGTAITVEDMFYNLPTRRAALRSPSEEYRAIVDVVSRYAIRYPTVAFVCKRLGTSSSSRATPMADVRTEAGATNVDNIRAAFGSVVCNETLPLEVQIEDAKATASAVISSANFSMKKGIFIFFINGRLVDCNPLKRAIASTYSPYLPKSGQPFVYIDLTMPQEDVDVNVHPMKKEVRFLNESSIIDAIVMQLTVKLKGTETSRTFLAQSILVSDPKNTPLSGRLKRPQPQSKSQSQMLLNATNGTTNSEKVNKNAEGGGDLHGANQDDDCGDEVIQIQPKRLLDDLGDVDMEGNASGSAAGRLDDTVEAAGKRRLQTYLSTDDAKREVTTPIKSQAGVKREYAKDIIRTSTKDPVGLLDRFVTRGTGGRAGVGVEVRRKRRANAMPLLTSVEHLLELCRGDCHKGVAEILKEQTFVGVASDRFAVIQHASSILLADVEPLVTQLVYQQCLRRFGDHDVFEVRPGAPVLRVVQAALTQRLRDASDATLVDAESVANVLLEKGKILEEYFGMQLQGECAQTLTVCKLPLVFGGVGADMRRLGDFLHELAVCTDWQDEDSCFHAIARAFAHWYGKHWTPFDHADGANRDGDEDANGRTDVREWTLNHVLFAAMRSDYWPPKAFFAQRVVREITCTSKLYKIFERC